MTKDHGYLIAPFDNPVSAILEGIDRDVERGEDTLMLGLGLVMLSSIFASIAPPTVLLPIVAVIFGISFKSQGEANAQAGNGCAF